MSDKLNSLFKDNKLSVITFSTTEASFAIPLEQVLYIEKDVKRNIQVNARDEFNHEVITFQNETVQLLDFNRLVGSENHHEKMTNMVKTLDSMEKLHIDWLDALEESITSGTAFNMQMDARKCEFGKWYDDFESDNEELKEVMARFDAPHKKFHALAKTLLLIAEEDKAKALRQLNAERNTTLAELVHLFALAKERAMNSVRPIILFVEHANRKVTALRLDNINDIVSYDKKDFSLDDSSEGIMRKRNPNFVVEGFLRNGDEAPLILINCKSSLGATSRETAV